MEHRIVHFAGQFALEPLVLDQVGFLTQANPFKEKSRRSVAGVDPCHDAPSAQLTEGKVEQRGHRLVAYPCRPYAGEKM